MCDSTDSANFWYCDEHVATDARLDTSPAGREGRLHASTIRLAGKEAVSVAKGAGFAETSADADDVAPGASPETRTAGVCIDRL